MGNSRPDLNLAIALHAFLEERHVSRAAARIGVSQPAASVMLRRLRRHFGDELLMRVGNGYKLTPLGFALQKQAGDVLELSSRLFATKFDFDPLTTEREFTLALSDYASIVLGAALLDAMAAQAPHAKIHFRPLRITNRTDEESSLRAIDGVILPRGAFSKEFPRQELFEDDWVGITSVGNTFIGDELSADDLKRVDLVVAHDDPFNGNPIIQRLEELGVGVRYRSSVDSFLALPHLIGSSDRFAIIQRRLVDSLALDDRIRVVQLPLDLGSVVETLWWHPTYVSDPGHTWFRQVVLEAARTAQV